MFLLALNEPVYIYLCSRLFNTREQPQLRCHLAQFIITFAIKQGDEEDCWKINGKKVGEYSCYKNRVS